jgi:hypothetical protein
VCVAQIQRVTEYSSFYTTHKSFVSTGFAEQIVFILFILCYNGSLVTWTVVSLTTAKFKPLIFSVCFTLSYTANIIILMILYDSCLLPAQFCYIIVYTRKVENCVQIADRCAPWKISSSAQNLVLHALQFFSSGLGSSLYSLGSDPTENIVSIFIAQKFFDCCLHIRCRRNLFMESLPSNELLLWLSDVMSQYKFRCENVL